MVESRAREILHMQNFAQNSLTVCRTKSVKWAKFMQNCLMLICTIRQFLPIYFLTTISLLL